MRQFEFNPDKFKELVLYIADRSQEDANFGATKLNKILYFSDFLAYGQLGAPITGARYQRLDMGPAPKELLPMQSDLVTAGDAVVVERERFGYPQKKVLALRDPRLDLFSADEIAIVDRVLGALRQHNAASVSELSHRTGIGWEMAEDREEIPYQTIFVSTDPLTPRDIRRAQELAKEHGWLAQTI